MKLAIMKSFLSILTGGGVAAITLFPFGIFFKNQTYLNNPRTVNHEKIHWQQQIETCIAGVIMSTLLILSMIMFNWSLWWLFLYIPFPFLLFYLEYVIEWFIKLFIYGNGAYKNLSTEREAYKYDDDLNYLKTRKRFNWLKYIFRKS